MSDSWSKAYEDTLPSDTIIMPVEAFRIWYKPIESLFLRSYWIQLNWIPGQKLEAECQNHTACVCTKWEGAHAGRCNAGIYAFKTFDQGYDLWRDQLEEMLGLDAPEPVQNRIVFGKVYLWGKVIECTKGFRGQYAYPSGLYYTADTTPALAQFYNVPLLAMKDHNRAYHPNR